MPIKRSVLDKKWYYRIARVLFLWIVPILVVLVLLTVLYSDAGSATDAVIFAVVLAVYLLVLKGVWRGFLYLAFGGLENDTKKKVKTVVRSAGPTTPVKIPTETKANIVAKAIVQAIGWSLILWLGWLILGQFLNGSNSNPTPAGNTNGGSVCNTGCGNWYRCDGQYYDADGIQRVLHACLPVPAPNAGYSSWSGRCTKCP